MSRSVLGSETMAFADAFDMAFVIKIDLERMLGNSIPISMVTDSLSLFDVVTRASVFAEKRLLIDIEAVKGAYKSNEIETVGFVRTSNNPADALTKVGRCPVLEEILSSAKLTQSFEQWIDRR